MFSTILIKGVEARGLKILGDETMSYMYPVSFNLDHNYSAFFLLLFTIKLTIAFSVKPMQNS